MSNVKFLQRAIQGVQRRTSYFNKNAKIPEIITKKQAAQVIRSNTHLDAFEQEIEKRGNSLFVDPARLPKNSGSMPQSEHISSSIFTEPKNMHTPKLDFTI